MEIEKDEIIYEKTDNPNIIKRIRLVEDEIYIDTLEKQIMFLNNKIDNLSFKKDTADKETLDFWNSFVAGEERTKLEEEIARITVLIEELKALPKKTE